VPRGAISSLPALTKEEPNWDIAQHFRFRLSYLSVRLVYCELRERTRGQRIDNIPMYGQPEIARPDSLKKADEDFIAKASAGFDGNRRAASDAWIAEGDRYMRERNLDYAMRRYNQAWLLNPDGYKPYWGFARVTLEQQKFDEAFRYFEKARQLIDDKYQEAALVSDIGIGINNRPT